MNRISASLALLLAAVAASAASPAASTDKVIVTVNGTPIRRPRSSRAC